MIGLSRLETLIAESKYRETEVVTQPEVSHGAGHTVPIWENHCLRHTGYCKSAWANQYELSGP